MRFDEKYKKVIGINNNAKLHLGMILPISFNKIIIIMIIIIELCDYDLALAIEFNNEWCDVLWQIQFSAA